MRVLLTFTTLLLTACADAPPTVDGAWRAWLDSPGGELPFGLDWRDGTAFLTNGEEQGPIAEFRLEGREVVLGIPHYDAEIRAMIDTSGDRMDGSWRRRNAGADDWSELPFHATRGAAPRFAATGEAPSGDLSGRWIIDFSEDEDVALGTFTQDGDGIVHGTMQTTVGDYRYLAGRVDGDRLRLSTFDGAHAFLFTATLGDDGTLTGDFWSRNTWHESWTAVRGDAEMPDAFALSRWREATELSQLSYPDTDGTVRALDDPAFAGKVRLIQVFGTWCPNCNDATELLVELEDRYGSQGLSILGLAFEMTGDFERDAGQVRVYRDKHGFDFPVLIAGTSDKAEASKAFPALDRVRAYPTSIFLDAEGTVQAVYTGFSGPATGPAHDRLREQFETLIEELLGEG